MSARGAQRQSAGRWWLDRGMPYTPKRMHAIFRDLVTPGVQRVLEDGGAG